MTLLAIIEQESQREVSAESTFESLGMDSLDFIAAILRVEKVFDVEIPELELLQFRTVGDVAAWIEAHT